MLKERHAANGAPVRESWRRGKASQHTTHARGCVRYPSYAADAPSFASVFFSPRFHPCRHHDGSGGCPAKSLCWWPFTAHARQKMQNRGCHGVLRP